MTERGPFRLDGRVAAVTGGGSGIGRAIVLRLARQGALVAVLDQDAAAGNGAAEEAARLGGTAEAFTCDVSRAAEVDGAFANVAERFGRLDILVNCAGIGQVATIAGTSEADLDRLYAVNVKGTFLCTRAALPRLIAGGGGVVLNLSSIAALIGVAERFGYSVTKGAVLALTKSVAIDFLSQNVRCNCICPARVHTPFVDKFVRENYPGREDEVKASLAAYQPVGRMAEPEEVADLAVYLCSDEAAFITGQAVPFDGGVLLV
ncbi:MAG: SDR family oxidoreductase [Actinobacteria bacterium]|nr:SDR family oxidoreductase [Actinomycetota bacterium]